MATTRTTPAGVPTRDELAAAMHAAYWAKPPRPTRAVLTGAELDELAGAALALVLERRRQELTTRKRRSRARERANAA